MASFGAQTLSFFDELARIRDESRKSRDSEMDRATQTPFPNLLTQDDEPNAEYRPPQYFDEPELILGRRIG